MFAEKSISSLVLAVISLSLISHAGAEPGFVPWDSAKIPSVLKARAPSIFRLVVLADSPNRVPRDRYAEFLKIFGQSGFPTKLVKAKLDKCEGEQPRPEFCDVEYVGFGTAFLAEKENRIWTVRHNFEFANPNLATLPLDANFQPKFVLYDQSGTIRFDSRNEKDEAKLVLLLPETLLKEEFSASKGRILTDLVAIDLNRNIPGAKPLTFGSPPPIGSKIFGTGFPVATRSREIDTKSADSDGISLYATLGTVIGEKKMFELIGEELPGNEGTVDKMLVISDADGARSQSGGPVFDEKGFVIGIYASGIPKVGETRDDYYTPSNIALSSNWAKSLIEKYGRR
jgi:hypothetical protein